MLSSFLFTAERSERVEDWRAALEDLDDKELLWIALRDASEEEESALCEGLFLGEQAGRLRESPERACVTDDGEHLYATLYAVGRCACSGAHSHRVCHWPELATHRPPRRGRGPEEFLERAEGGGQIGQLDAPSLVAAISEWVIASYLRAFEAVEAELEELDAKIISETPGRDVSDDLGKLVELRRRIGSLRRGLAPHREVVFSLQHPELDALSSEDSAQRFANLERRVTQALESARDTKDSAFGTFDLLVARIGQRTNDIMKVLTLGTVILLPATALAGIMGMNSGSLDKRGSSGL